MALSSARAYLQWQSVDNSGAGAGQQWLHALWYLYNYFFTTASVVDAGRWGLVGSSMSAGDWGTLSNVVNNSWFVIEAIKGVNHWQAKFQATNAVALSESPGTTYCLAVNLCSGGGWTAFGAANGGFSDSAVVCSGNLLLGGQDCSGYGSHGAICVHGDRDTVLTAITRVGYSNFECGGYIGRFDPESDSIHYPECVLTACNSSGVPAGFDRSSGGAFGATPSGSHVLSEAETPASVPVQVWTSGWMTSTYQPSGYSGEYAYRPLEITSATSYLGTLRMAWAVAGIAANVRVDYRQKLVLHSDSATDGVCVAHNGKLGPQSYALTPSDLPAVEDSVSVVKTP